jgi:hypothetical protein
MRKSTFWSCLLACALGAYVPACGDDDDAKGDEAGSGAKAGTGGAGGSKTTGGSGGGGVKVDPINDDCPQNDIGPTTGDYAQKGACCYRASNAARVDPKADTLTLSYRLNYFKLINHQKTINATGLLGTAQVQRAEGEEQSVLFRFEMPQKEGKVIDGEGKLTIGAGRYNCDGTYSYYSDKAAPTDTPIKGPADRWSTSTIPAKVTAAKTDKDRIKPTFKDQLAVKNKASRVPYLAAGPDYGIDFEGESQGFDLLEMPSKDENIECVGSRTSTSWKPGGKSIAYGSVALNDTPETIDAVGVNFCKLMAFGTSPDAAKADCSALPRCEPDSKDCLWQRLPDSLCPVTDDEKKKWTCHLGYDDNPDNPFKSKCSKDVPDNVDPDNGAMVEGQCCDPLGKGTNGLPACNAWLQVNEFVAAAAEITDKLADQMQQSCHGK